jgi:hypothetical protein
MLAEAEQEERQSKMLQRYTELSVLPGEERASQMLMMAKAEYDLPDDKLRTFTVSRLSVWLSMDTEVVQQIASSYDGAMKKMPGTQAMRRVSMVQSLADEFSREQQQQLIAMVPEVFGGLKEILSRPSIQSVPAPASAKKSWWPFGKR